MRRVGCTCPIEVVDVDHDGTPVRDCIDPACDCDVCGHFPSLPLHLTEAGYPNCSTCGGGGCRDCTESAYR